MALLDHPQRAHRPVGWTTDRAQAQKVLAGSARHTGSVDLQHLHQALQQQRQDLVDLTDLPPARAAQHAEALHRNQQPRLQRWVERRVERRVEPRVERRVERRLRR
ncbi:hypothetical protein [Kineococcus gypseus]|uniref:hypothetical protein n=1 Tax=Kineococcus gypseus TaxID=1637102 RepID=UPI003D7D36CE